MNQDQLKRLVVAVHRWLSFQQMCDRAAFFSESYLSQPIAEFIAAHHSGKIAPEYNHPQFATLSNGRPKQVDFALLTKNASAVETVVEAKWVRDYKYSKQAIMDDLLRLECFRMHGRHVRRYFLVAGLKSNVTANFFSLKYRDGGDHQFTSRFLKSRVESDVNIVKVFDTKSGLQKFYKRFEENYRSEVPKTFTTKLMAKTRTDELSVY